MSGRARIALDFDGVLHEYAGWNEGRLGDPIAGARRMVEALAAQGAEVVVFSARASDAAGAGAIVDWLERHGFPDLPVTSSKLPEFTLIVDDRAARFGRYELDWMRERPEGFAAHLLAMRPYWARAEATA